MNVFLTECATLIALAHSEISSFELFGKTCITCFECVQLLSSFFMGFAPGKYTLKCVPNLKPVFIT